MVKPWIEAGYHAVTVDLQPGLLAGASRHINMDVRKLPEASRKHPNYLGCKSEVVMVFAFPPCTHLAVSGARWFKEKGMGKLIEGLEVVEACREFCESSGVPWMLENPVGTLSTYWREPDSSFDPCDYGDPYTKKTCIWHGNGFVMPPIVRGNDMFAEATAVEPTLGSMMHRMTGKVNGENNFARSITPMGFAQAVFRANAR
jgi:hypothetical protein